MAGKQKLNWVSKLSKDISILITLRLYQEIQATEHVDTSPRSMDIPNVLHNSLVLPTPSHCFIVWLYSEWVPSPWLPKGTTW